MTEAHIASLPNRTIAPTDLGIDVAAYGAKADCVLLTDANITGGLNILTSASATFTNNDVGKLVGIQLAGTTNAPFASTIASVIDPHTVTLAANATNTVVLGFAAYGTDNLPAFNAAKAVVVARVGGRGTILIGQGDYAISGAWILGSGINVVGAGRTQTSIYLIASITQAGSPPFAAIQFSNPTGNATVDRVSLSHLRVGVIPADGRSLNGYGVAMLATNFLVEDIEVNVPGATWSTLCAGILVYAGTNSGPAAGPGVISNCSFINCIAGGTFHVCCIDTLTIGCYVVGSGDDALAIISGNGGTTASIGNKIIGCHVRNSFGRGIVMVGGTNWVIADNTVIRTFGSGIGAVSQAGFLSNANGVIEGNLIVSAGINAQATYAVQTGAPPVPVGSPNGIHVDAASNVLQVAELTITGNQIQSSKLCHIAVVGSGATVAAVGVVITGNSTSGSAGGAVTTGQNLPNGIADVAHCPGIYCHLADFISVIGNKIEGANREGIVIDSTCTTGDAYPVVGNTVHNAGANAAAATVAGILVAVNGAIVTGNYIDNGSGHVTISVDLQASTAVCGGNQANGIAFANSASAKGWAQTTGTVS